ncbi:hypothetical protein DTO212C5_8770 [Paecilomyces variotii]|nr:hypothetical protein DTO212C5_8770 [Paecilomyces variotii]
MASVSSLDRDLRNMRLSKYTPQAANEVREWIEEVLHEKLASGDLIAALKDGVALCKLVNLAVSPGVKYKQSSMPFVQMENISHFLRAIQMPPLSLPPHDVFLTVDLYESKDPAQVLQCLGAFSRRANAIEPAKFPRTLGAKSKAGAVTPQLTGSSQSQLGTRPRGASNASNPGALSPAAASTTSGRSSPGKGGSPSPRTPVSSWSRKTDETVTAPAWNIHQYGYMGGASQANQGVTFGARRQITSPLPAVPSLAEKEKKRREAAAEEERRRRQAQEEEEERRRIQREEEEANARAEEERRWAEETERLRENERREVEEQKKKWDDEQRKWEEEEQRRLQEEKELEEKFNRERQRTRGLSDARLNGQFLSQYQAHQPKSPPRTVETAESQRIKELERELELAKERERQYERERLDLREKQERDNRSRSRSHPRPVQPSYDLSSLEEERKLLRKEWQQQQDDFSAPPMTPPRQGRPLPDPKAAQQTSPRPLPDPKVAAQTSPRPLPSPAAYASRTDRFLASNPAPSPPKPSSHRPEDYSSTAEIDAENSRRIAAQQKTRAGGWASKSLLEREMERERERQREWEEGQKQTSEAAKKGLKDDVGVGPGQGAWDVHQYGFMGGDNQNRGGPGLGIGGARRQIIGPRPPP